MYIKDAVKRILGRIRVMRFHLKAGQHVYIGYGCNIKGKIMLSSYVVIRPCVQIWCGGVVQIGEGSEIGERSRISIKNSCEIGANVLLSPNVYITDCDHEYRNINIPIINQGIVQQERKVLIGKETYVGINCVIVGDVTIGEHCVIGANSVVTKDIPDYSVAVGCPAKVIKRFDRESETWQKVKEWSYGCR